MVSIPLYGGWYKGKLEPYGKEQDVKIWKKEIGIGGRSRTGCVGYTEGIYITIKHLVENYTGVQTVNLSVEKVL